MDFSSFVGYAESLGFIYAWTFLAAGTFALIERIVTGYMAGKRQADNSGQDAFKTPAS